MMVIIIILCIFLPVAVFGQPQLRSSIGSLELSGEQCPGTLTLTCDARNFGTSDRIIWFVRDESVAVYDAIDDSTPFTTTTTRPDILNATVQLTTATLTGGQFSFINFTLSASVSNFLPLQGHNISCGKLLLRSSPFGIRSFTVINEAPSYQDMSYLAKYSGLEGRLMEIMLKWTENITSNCTIIISYSANILNNNMSMTRNFTSEVCSSSQCSYEIDFTQNITSDLIVEFYADGNLISSNIIANITGNIIIEDSCRREVSIRCSNFTNENCTIDYQQEGMDMYKIIPPSNISVLPTKVLRYQVTQVMTNNESTILQQNVIHVFEDIGSNVAALIVVVIALYLLALAEHLVAALVFFLFGVSKKRDVEQCWKRLIPILLFMATVMYFIIAIVWIVAFLRFTRDLCGTLKSTEIAIHIVALVLSIMITLISTIILAVVVIVCPCKENQEVAGQDKKSYDFTFGSKKTEYDHSKLEKVCPNCNEELSWVKVIPKYCDVCGKQMCSKCIHKITFLFRMMGFGRACKVCEKEYMKQNEQFANHDDSIGKMSLLWREKSGEPCHDCNDQSTKRELICSICGKGICSKIHTRNITEEKEETIEDSKTTEEMIDDGTNSETAVSSKQVKDQEATDSEIQVVTGDHEYEQEVLGETGDKDIKRKGQVCRMCYTVYKRKEQFNTKQKKEERVLEMEEVEKQTKKEPKNIKHEKTVL